MITIWELDPSKKEVKSVTLDQWKIGKTLTWVDCYNPSEKELNLLSKKTSISTSEFEHSISELRRPHVTPAEKYSEVVFRGPCIGYNDISTVPIGIFLFKKDVITLHSKPIRAINTIRNLPKSQLALIFKKGAPYFVYRLLDALVSDYFNILDELGEKINIIENKVLHNVKESIVKNIFLIKRIFIFFHKSLIANRDVISAIEKHYLKEFKEQDMRHFRDLYSDTTQLIDLVSNYREILTSILEMYLSSINNALNKTVKTLTALSAFVLIPTLIAGIYGMNFANNSIFNMPELYWKYGYFFSIGLMILSVLLTYLIFKKKDWL